MRQPFATTLPLTSRSGAAFVLYAAGLWTAIIGIGVSLFAIGFGYTTSSAVSVFPHFATLLSAEVIGVTADTTMWWEQDVYVAYLGLGLSVITIGLLLILTGHIVRSRRHELHTIQSHQEEL